MKGGALGSVADEQPLGIGALARGLNEVAEAVDTVEGLEGAGETRDARGVQARGLAASEPFGVIEGREAAGVDPIGNRMNRHA